MKPSSVRRPIRIWMLATAVLTMAVAVPTLAQAPFLVADIDTTGEPYYGDCFPGPCPPPNSPLYGGLPQGLTPWGDLLAFIANDRVHGFEPWISDGTAAGTRLLADLVPGDGGSHVEFLGQVGDDLLFWGRSAGQGPCGLWRADHETLAVAPLDLGPDHPLGSERPDSCQIEPIGPGIPFGSSLFFEVLLPGTGGERVLARSDGTAEGTEVVLEICGVGDPCNAAGPRVARLGSRLFVGTDSGLWTISAPAAEPALFSDLPCVGALTPIPSSSLIQDLVFVSGCLQPTLNHLVPDPAGPADTEPLHTFGRQGSGLYPMPADLTPWGTDVYFVVYRFDVVPRQGEIWKTDGTPEGTRPVVETFRGNGFAFPDLTVVGNRLVFVGVLPSGIPEETPVSRLYSLTSDDVLVPLVGGQAFLSDLLTTGTRAFLSLETAPYGTEPWVTDGTPEGTRLLADLAPGEASSIPYELTRVGDLLFFSAETEELGRELWAVRLTGDEVPPPTDPDPPFDGWIEPPVFPDFRFQVRITPEGGSAIPGSEVLLCQDDTVCVSGAVPGRPEVYLRILGPRANGFLWPTVIRFTPSRVEVWVEQESTGQVRYYDLPAVGPGDDDLPGRQDRTGFAP